MAGMWRYKVFEIMTALKLGQLVIPAPPGRWICDDEKEKRDSAVVINESPLVLSSLDGKAHWERPKSGSYLAVGSVYRQLLNFCQNNWLGARAHRTE